MVEQETNGRLEAFRSEIKKIVEGLGDTNGDTRNIKNFEELNEEDMRHWQEIIDILSAIDKLDPKQEEDKEKITQHLQDLEKAAKQLSVEVRASYDETKISKSSFNALLNNLNPLSQINYALKLGSDVEKLKKITREHRTLFVQGGWKTAGSQKST